MIGRALNSFVDVAASRRAALWLFLAALVVRALAAALLASAAPGVEIWEYGRQGLCAVQTGGDLCLRDDAGHAYVSAYMPPLTSYLWVELFALLGQSGGAQLGYIVLNVLIGAACAPLLFALGRRAGLAHAPCFLAVLILALYPTFVFVATGYHATNFTVALVLAFALLLLRAMEGARWGAALLAGIAAGLAVLTRTEMLLASAVGALLLAWSTRANLRKAALAVAALALGVGLVVGPWTVRNAMAFDRFIPVANSQGYNLWKAFGPYAEGSGNQVERAPASHAALEHIRASVALGDAPGDRYENRVQDAFAAETPALGDIGFARLIQLTLQKLALLFVFDWTDPLTHSFAYWAPWLFTNVLVLYGAGLLAARRGEGINLDAALVIVMLLGVMSFAYAVSGIHARYRMHIEPFLFLFAGYGLWDAVLRLFKRETRAP